MIVSHNDIFVGDTIKFKYRIDKSMPYGNNYEKISGKVLDINDTTITLKPENYALSSSDHDVARFFLNKITDITIISKGNGNNEIKGGKRRKHRSNKSKNKNKNTTRRRKITRNRRRH
jgi:hypothetical protein